LIFNRIERFILGVEDVMVQLVELPKNSSVVGCKWNFKELNDIQGVEELKINLMGLQSVVGCNWRSVPRSRFKWGLDL